MTSFRSRTLFGLLVLSTFWTGPGCSQGVKKITVTGTVTYKGLPVRSGILKFVGPEGAYSAGVIQSDGTYIVTDVVPGETRVGIMATPQGSGSSSGEKSPAAQAAISLPEKYREAATSGLVYTITPENPTLNIEIK